MIPMRRRRTSEQRRSRGRNSAGRGWCRYDCAIRGSVVSATRARIALTFNDPGESIREALNATNRTIDCRVRGRPTALVVLLPASHCRLLRHVARVWRSAALVVVPAYVRACPARAWQSVCDGCASPSRAGRRRRPVLGSSDWPCQAGLQIGAESPSVTPVGYALAGNCAGVAGCAGPLLVPQLVMVVELCPARPSGAPGHTPCEPAPAPCEAPHLPRILGGR
jgi:hypothetical protein